MSLRLRAAVIAGLALIAAGLSPALAVPRPISFEKGLAAYEAGNVVEAVRQWEILAREGDHRAQFRFGLLLAEGLGVPRDEAAAVHWFREAMLRGNADAGAALGRMKAAGRGVGKDQEEAQRLFLDAAERGSADALYDLGEVYERGAGVVADLGEAYRWYDRAAYAYPPGKEQVKAEAARARIVKAAGRPPQSAAGDYYKGIAAYERKEYPAAAAFWRPLAEAGQPRAQYRLGQMLYSGGSGLSEDRGQAVRWFRAAAEQGDARAQSHLCLAYEVGQGVAKDYSLAFAWCRKAAEQGDAGGMYALGMYHFEGKGVPVDLAEARFWFERTAETPIRDRYRDLALSNLKRVDQQMTWPERFARASAAHDRGDVAAAVEIWLALAKEGHGPAQLRIAQLYEAGRGVAQDLGKARHWYGWAAATLPAGSERDQAIAGRERLKSR